MQKLRCFFLLCTLGAVAAVNAQTPTTAPELPVAIPEYCNVWFDGCNTCQVGPFDEATQQYQLACTRKYCPPEALEPPRCLEFEDASH